MVRDLQPMLNCRPPHPRRQSAGRLPCAPLGYSSSSSKNGSRISEER